MYATEVCSWVMSLPLACSSYMLRCEYRQGAGQEGRWPRGCMHLTRACRALTAASVRRPRRARARPASAAAARVSAPERRGAPDGAAPGASDARSHSTEVVVVGAGLGGLCCAALLAKYGVQVPPRPPP